MKNQKLKNLRKILETKRILEEAEVEYKVSKPEVLTIENGMMTGASEGFTDVQVNITVNGNKVSSNTVRVKVGNPEVEEEVIVNPVRNFKVIDKTKKSVTVSWEEPEKNLWIRRVCSL